jgi:hypothetical protein
VSAKSARVKRHGPTREKRKIQLPAQYSHTYPVSSGHNYLLRAVPLDVWQRAMKRASNEQRAIRGVLIRALERYADSGIE